MLSIRGNILELFGNLKNSWLKKKNGFGIMVKQKPECIVLEKMKGEGL